MWTKTAQDILKRANRWFQPSRQQSARSVRRLELGFSSTESRPLLPWRRHHLTTSMTEDNGRLIFDTTKTGEERTVPLPRLLAEQFTTAVATSGPGRARADDRRGSHAIQASL